MNKAIAYCGYDCTKCPVYKATESNDLDFLKSIVITPGQSNINQTIESLGCFGCINNNVNHMCSNCSIRICAKSENIENCGYCKNFPCEKLSNISEQTMDLLMKINNQNKGE